MNLPKMIGPLFLYRAQSESSAVWVFVSSADGSNFAPVLN
jgi:hypothetical protein